MADKWQACAVCGYPLQRVNGQHWVHLNPADRDHVIVPVDIDQLRFNQRCDFCSGQEPSWVILADSFFIPGLNSRSLGHWSACEDCKPLVMRRRWEDLLVQVRAKGMVPPWPGDEEDPLLITYLQLGLHMYGAITMDEWRARGSLYPS